MSIDVIAAGFSISQLSPYFQNFGNSCTTIC